MTEMNLKNSTQDELNQQAKKEFDKAFAELRAFNGWYVKTFKKEIAADRKNKYKIA